VPDRWRRALVKVLLQAQATFTTSIQALKCNVERNHIDVRADGRIAQAPIADDKMRRI
jgi:hypothetical protein